MLSLLISSPELLDYFVRKQMARNCLKELFNGNYQEKGRRYIH